MKIEMLETAAGPWGVMHAGKVYDLPKRDAESLLQPGPHGRAYARPAETRGKAAKVSRASEEADEEEEG